MDYREFIEGKVARACATGFEVAPSEVNPILYGHQRDIVCWAVAGGCRAVFAKFGLGKTMIQLEILRIVKSRVSRKNAQKAQRCLIVCPLGVKQEFVRDGAKLGLTVEYVRTTEEALSSTADICITNYERVRDGQIDPNLFCAVSLDEASILRGYGTKTYQEFLKLFPDVEFRFVCTATPSPNRFKELIHYAGFLGIMDTGQALTRFFQRDSTQANNLTCTGSKSARRRFSCSTG